MPTKVKPTSRTKSGSKPKSKLSTKLVAAIVIGIVAITGIAIVFSSFASGPPAYQYSYNASCPKKTTNINVKTNQIVTTTGADIVTVPVDPKSDCVKDSAEAMAYRLYYITYAKDPLYDNFKSKEADPGTYAGLVQALAGNRTKPQLIFPNDTYKNPADLATFVRTMYKNAVNRTPSDKEVNDWLKNIKDNKLDRADVATLFAGAPEAKVNLSGKFANYIKNNPKPVVTIPTAQNQQNARTAEAKKKLDEMVGQKDALISEKNSLLKNNNLTTAKQAQDRINLRMIRVKQIDDEIKKLLQESKNLTQYAANISDVDIANYSKLSNNIVTQCWEATVQASNHIGRLINTASTRNRNSNTNRSSGQSASNNNDSPTRTNCRPAQGYSEFRTVTENTLRQEKRRKLYPLGSYYNANVVTIYNVNQIRQRFRYCSNGNEVYSSWGPWRETSRSVARQYDARF